MASYTQSIREILQANKTAQQSLTNPSDVYDIAMLCLFNDAPINVISSEYREAFVTGFTLHFFNDELGLETLPLWKVALNEKLINNAAFINLIYEHLDKQIFADYRVINVNASGTTSDTKTGSVSGTKSNTNSNTTTTDDDNTHSSQDTISKTNTLTKTGTDTLAHTGTQSVSDENSSTTESSSDKSTDTNTVQINSDTPQGSLQNLRNPGGDAKGTGVSYVNGQTYTYMSSASELDQSNVESDSSTESVTGTDDSTTTFNDTNTSTHNTVDENVEGGTVSNSATDERDIKTVASGTSSEEIQNTTSDTSSGSRLDNSNTIDYSINWEMLLKTVPYLDKVWDLFDDIFMFLL